MGKKRQSRWRKLDNAAQAFPAATGKKDSRVFRFYCVLKESVDADRLQSALDRTLDKYPLSFVLCFAKDCSGFIWSPANCRRW